MNNKNKIIILIATAIVVAIIIFIISLLTRNSFDNKTNILKAQLHNNQNYNKQEACVVFISISDTKNTAKIIHSTKQNNFEMAWNEAVNETKKYIKENKYDAKWIKIDVSQNIKKVTYDKLTSDIMNANTYSKFQYGIAIDNKFEIAILPQELECNSIINYEYARS